MPMKSQPRSPTKSSAKRTVKASNARRATKTGFINARIEPGLKKKAEAVLDKIGLTTTAAVTIFFKQVVAQKGLPFSVNVPNRETIRAMRDIEQGRTESFTGTPEELFAYLLDPARS